MEKTVTIYALVDPRDPFRVRYVGKTVNRATRRLSQHLTTRSRQKSHKNDWVRALLRDSVEPAIIGIQECSEAEWQKWERFWIAHFKSFGLVNSTEGGDWVHDQTGFRHTEETKKLIGSFNALRKMGVKHLRNIPKTPRHLTATGRAILKENGLKRRGVPMGYEVRKSVSRKLTGRKLSEVTKAKLNRIVHQLHPNACDYNAKRVMCVETGIVYKSTKELAATLGVSCGAVRDHLRGRLHSLSGRHFKRFLSDIKTVRCRETGEEFGTVRQAAESKGAQYQSILNALTGRSKSCAGFHWEKI